MMTELTSDQRPYLDQIEAYIARLPGLSTTAAKVLQTCNNPQSSPNEINRLIALDPVLTAQVLRLINSACYSLCHPVSSLTRAIIMLGINTVKNLVLSFAILEQLRTPKNFRVLSIAEFWEHSVAVGVIAKCIAAAKGVPLAEQEDYFVSGLLHDLGKIPLNDQFADQYGQALAMTSRSGLLLVDAERDVFGFDHSTVGGLIAQKWQLSPAIVDVLAGHHRPDESPAASQQLVFIIALADLFSQLLETDCPAEDQLTCGHTAHVLARAGMDWPLLEGMRAAVHTEIDKAKIFLEISQTGSAP